MILLPAYGRDYKTKEALLAAFHANESFICRIWNHPDTYINKEDIDIGEEINFRYNHERDVFIYKVR